MAVLEIAAKPPTLAEQVGLRIRAVRKGRELTLKQLADAMGTTPQTVQRLEMGTMALTVDWIECFAKALGVEPVVFFTDPSERLLGNVDAIEDAAKQFSRSCEMARHQMMARIAAHLLDAGGK